MTEENQDTLFDYQKDWESEWEGMPEYNMNRIKPVRVIKINFMKQEDITRFEKLLGQKITPNVENYWYPKANIKTVSSLVYTDEP